MGIRPTYVHIQKLDMRFFPNRFEDIGEYLSLVGRYA
jgi:hypothetical protein